MHGQEQIAEGERFEQHRHAPKHRIIVVRTQFRVARDEEGTRGRLTRLPSVINVTTDVLRRSSEAGFSCASNYMTGQMLVMRSACSVWTIKITRFRARHARPDHGVSSLLQHGEILQRAHQPDHPRWLRKSRVRSVTGDSTICPGGPCPTTPPPPHTPPHTPP